MNQLKLISFCLLLTLLWQGTGTTQAQGSDWRFGAIESYEASSDASRLGIGWTRVQIHWADTQAGGPGTWTPPVSDAQINGELAAGRSVVGLLIGIPDWARDGSQLPQGLWLPHDDANNVWANFVREAVTRYNGRINHWIIWNEPNIDTWQGSVEDFFQLQRTAYLAAKSVDPAVNIHLGAIHLFGEQPDYLYRLLDTIVADPGAAEHNYYFDAATAHLYFQPDQIFSLVQQVYGAILSRGIPWKPVWLVETNAPPFDDPTWGVSNPFLLVTEDEQAAFMPQAMAAALAAGAQRIAVYKMRTTESDRAADPEPFGLLRIDGSRRPAFTTYQVAIRYLAGMRGASRERWNEVGQLRIDQGEQSTTVVFSRLPAPQQAQVTAVAPTALLVDMWGTQRTITAVDGFFNIDLPPALCTQPIGDYCMIGGTTYYVVQAADGAVTAPIIPTEAPEAVPSSEPVTTTLSVATPLPDTVTPTATATFTPTATPTPMATVSFALPPATPTIPPILPTATTVMATETGAASQSQLSYWFIGLGLLLSAIMGFGWWHKRIN